MNWFSKQFTPSKIWEINEIVCRRCEPTVQLAAICPQDIFFFFLFLIAASYLYLDSLTMRWIEFSLLWIFYFEGGRDGKIYNYLKKIKINASELKCIQNWKKLQTLLLKMHLRWIIEWAFEMPRESFYSCLSIVSCLMLFAHINISKEFLPL